MALLIWHYSRRLIEMGSPIDTAEPCRQYQVFISITPSRNKYGNLHSLEKKKQFQKKLRANIYFRTLRNLHRMNWLILYLFGASPIATKNFLSNKHRGFQKLDNHAYYLPYATSLRMSDLGYQNINQSNVAISLNSLQAYTADLEQATATKCDNFQKINKETTEDYPQINSSILQIEDEYYAVSRPKSSNVSNQRLTTKLKDTGVDYIELRSLDINPFSKNWHRFGHGTFLRSIFHLLHVKP